jgi:hypothetical protein
MKTFTIFTAVDKHHLWELNKVYFTWVEFKKEFRDSKLVIIYDADVLTEADLANYKSSRITLYPWKDNGLFSNQREKMLTALTIVPALICEDDWYLKIDTDTVALNDKQWVPWFEMLNSDSCFISHPWGITGPASGVITLDAWADSNNIPGEPIFSKGVVENDKFKMSRIISWLFFCKTSWHKSIVHYFKTPAGWKLPFPSQDTCLWYMAERLGNRYSRINFKAQGWDHRRVV